MAALRAEVGAWAPRHVPNLLDLAPRKRHWHRPVALASAVGAVALAALLLVSFAVVMLASDIPGGTVIRAHLIGP